MGLTLVTFSDEEEEEFKREKKRRKQEAQRPEAQPTYKGIRKKWRAKASSRRDGPFIAWDGEGTSNPGGQQPYCLFGASTKDYLKAPQLRTKEMLQLILSVGQENPYATHVSYAFVYDVNQILWEWNAGAWHRLFEDYTAKNGRKFKKGECMWRGYYIKWVPGKMFEVAGFEEETRKYVRVCIYDIFSFFGCKFTDALKTWVPEYQGNDVIERGKAKRDVFTWDDIAMIEEYWREEIDQLVVLADALRTNLRNGAELELGRWYGPGAIASALFKKHGTRDAMSRAIPDAVNEAAQHAYFAGRFELWQAGFHDGKVWQNDINSAYPAAMIHLPNLAKGKWVYVENVQRIDHFGVYHIRRKERRLSRKEEWLAFNSTQGPQPLPYRVHSGEVRFPEWVDGWYWSPEARLVWGDDSYEFVEGWVFVETDTSDRPFAWVADMYERRLRFKAEKNPAQLSVKLGLNSLYGKMAQRIGWDEETGEPPEFHQLEWAGWITSYTRASLYPLLREAWEKGALVSCETDSIMTTQELGVEWDGKTLGKWDCETYDGVIYLQNGLYFKNESGTWAQKIRGMDKAPKDADIKEGQKPLTLDLALWWMRREDCFKYELEVTTTRFIGIHKALHVNKPWLHRVWSTDEKHVKLGGNGKRVHIAGKCRACKEGRGNGFGFHDLSLSVMKTAVDKGRMSTKHKLPWKDEGVNEHRWRDEQVREWSQGGELGGASYAE